MPLSPGDKLGPYEILAPIGRGGMGEVYRARDPRLNRDIAIKVLPQGFATDTTRERFQREARAAPPRITRRAQTRKLAAIGSLY